MGCRRHEVLIKTCWTHWNKVIDLLHCILNELLAPNTEGAGVELWLRSAWIFTFVFLRFLFFVIYLMLVFFYWLIWLVAFACSSFSLFSPRKLETLTVIVCSQHTFILRGYKQIRYAPNCIPCLKRNNKDSFPSPARHAWWQVDDSNRVCRSSEKL